jgi:predicted DNA binding protein
VYTLDRDHGRLERFALTESQREALVLAVEDGYFEVPCRTTLTEVGKQLGVTEQPVPESVRWGADAVLKTVLFDQSERER